MHAIDNITDKNNVDFNDVAQLLLMVGVTVLSCSVFQWLMGLCINTVSYCTVRDIRRDIFRKFNAVPLRYIDGHPHGDLISRMINDADAVGDGLLQGITQLFSGLVMIICTLGFMLFINPYIALVVVVITPLSMFVAAFITKLSQKQFREQSKTQGEISSYIEEYIGQQKVVKAFGYEERSQEDFEEINSRLLECGKKAQFYSSLANPSTRFVNGIVTAAVCTVGSVSAINGTLSVGQISMFMTYANQYTKPFNEVTGVIPQLQSAVAGAARVFALLDELVEADETYILESQKGVRCVDRKPRKHGEGATKRGLSNELYCVCVATDRNNNLVATCINRAKPSGDDLVRALASHIVPQSVLLCDGATSYNKLAETLDSKKVELMGHESYDRLYHLNTVNSLHSRIKAMFRQLRGVASKYLNRYLALFTIIASCVKSTIAESADDLRRSLSAVREPITYLSSQTEGLLAL